MNLIFIFGGAGTQTQDLKRAKQALSLLGLDVLTIFWMWDLGSGHVGHLTGETKCSFKKTSLHGGLNSDTGRLGDLFEARLQPRLIATALMPVCCGLGGALPPSVAKAPLQLLPGVPHLEVGLHLFWVPNSLISCVLWRKEDVAVAT